MSAGDDTRRYQSVERRRHDNRRRSMRSDEYNNNDDSVHGYKKRVRREATPTATSSSSSSRCESLSDVSIQRYLSSINAFKDTSMVNDFLGFYARFRQAKSRRSTNHTSVKRHSTPVEEPSTTPPEAFVSLGLPKVYDKRHRLNIDVDVKSMNDMKEALLHYHRFLQDIGFRRLQRLESDRHDLPISAYAESLVECVRTHRVVVLAGDTGCGKSTQVPQYLLRAGFSNIAVTQPRRIACLALAKRVAYETLNEWGSNIAYQVRFEGSRTRHTRVLFLTEGLLIRQFSLDPTLSQYDVIIIDEVHERHVTCDTLLGLLVAVLRVRPTLRVLLMSATVNASMFSHYFDGAPIIQVPGRLYPITLEFSDHDHIDTTEQETIAARERGSHRDGGHGEEKIANVPQPLLVTSSSKEANRCAGDGGRRISSDTAAVLRIMARIERDYPLDERGDLLVFLSGVDEIWELEEQLLELNSPLWIVLPLHSSLGVAEQDRVFDVAPDGMRKCILATNIAETSVTIDGIRFVIDTGKVKEMGYDASSRMLRLREFWISRASAEQRRGRCGRTGPGVCFRLFSSSDFGRMLAYSIPEIRRIPITSVALQIASLGLGHAEDFPFIDPPPRKAIDSAISELWAMGALQYIENKSNDLNSKDRMDNRQSSDNIVGVTPMGRVLSNLPLDISLGRMLIVSTALGVNDADVSDPELVCTLAAAMSVQSPFVKRSTRGEGGNNSYGTGELVSSDGDMFTILNLFYAWVAIKAQRENSKKWCIRRGIEEQRLYEIAKLQRQFIGILRDSKLCGEDDEENIGGSSRRYQEQGHTDERTDKDRSLRRKLKEFRQQRGSRRRRRVLTVGAHSGGIIGADDESGENGGDLLDIEFQLSHNISAMAALTKGMYPHGNVALPDEHNAGRRPTERVFHTRRKGFVFMHPSSVFASAEAALIMESSHLSSYSAPIIYCFSSLLEIRKRPFLVNVLSAPAMPILLLLARSIDTDFACVLLGRLLVDDWLFLSFQSASDCAAALVEAHCLRVSWLDAIEKKLSNTDVVPPLRKSMTAPNFPVGLENLDSLYATPSILPPELLSNRLVAFITVDVVYSLTKLTPMTVAALRGLDSESLDGSKIGGETTTGDNWVRYGVLSNENTAAVAKASFLPNLKLRDCPAITEQLEPLPNIVKEEKKVSANARLSTCPNCGDSLLLSPLDMLRHQRQCQKEKG